jgi:hypothetical protein
LDCLLALRLRGTVDLLPVRNTPVAITTASHGGYKVDADRLDTIPLGSCKASFNGQGLNGWFEEDCDWCLVALSFPHLFTQVQLGAALRTFRCVVQAQGKPRLVRNAMLPYRTPAADNDVIGHLVPDITHLPRILPATPFWRAAGAICFKISSDLPSIGSSKFVNPVTLPPGRAKLCAQPTPTGSLAPSSTTGMERVSCIRIGTIRRRLKRSYN